MGLLARKGKVVMVLKGLLARWCYKGVNRYYVL